MPLHVPVPVIAHQGDVHLLQQAGAVRVGQHAADLAVAVPQGIAILRRARPVLIGHEVRAQQVQDGQSWEAALLPRQLHHQAHARKRQAVDKLVPLEVERRTGAVPVLDELRRATVRLEEHREGYLVLKVLIQRRGQIIRV